MKAFAMPSSANLTLTFCVIFFTWNPYHSVDAFANFYSIQTKSTRCGKSIKCSSTGLHALTERQIQFWEDVDEGIQERSEYFEGELGQSTMKRIRNFSLSAQGGIPKPRPSGPKHDPSEEYVEGLSAKPVWDLASEDAKTLFPWSSELEKKSHIIIKEYNKKLEKEREMRKEGLFSQDSIWQNKVMGEGWSALRLMRLGVWNTKNCQQFPETYALLSSLDIPFAVRGVCFAKQMPGSGVAEHSDGRNFILTAHLGLKVPQDCWIKVAEQEKTWEEGKIIIVDTSFKHSTGNPSDSERHVLIIDFWHPELTAPERAGLEFIYDLRNKFETGKVPVRKTRSVKQKEPQPFLGWWKTLTA